MGGESSLCFYGSSCDSGVKWLWETPTSWRDPMVMSSEHGALASVICPFERRSKLKIPERTMLGVIIRKYWQEVVESRGG